LASTIQQIQFKRGTKNALEVKLTSVAEGVLKSGEPAYETDTGGLKIGNGTSNYIDLPYITGGSGGLDPRFVIQDPVANQVLLYDETTAKWVNKDLADAESIIYLNSRGLTIKGYDSATQGQMLVKDTNSGLAWINPITTDELQVYVDQAATHAANAGNSAINAGNSAVEASTSASTAARINQQTMQWVNEKFWWGTLEEYNKLTTINPGTFYFITAG